MKQPGPLLDQPRGVADVHKSEKESVNSHWSGLLPDDSPAEHHAGVVEAPRGEGEHPHRQEAVPHLRAGDSKLAGIGGNDSQFIIFKILFFLV